MTDDEFSDFANYPTVQGMLINGQLTIEQAQKLCFNMLDALPALTEILRPKDDEP